MGIVQMRCYLCQKGRDVSILIGTPFYLVFYILWSNFTGVPLFIQNNPILLPLRLLYHCQTASPIYLKLNQSALFHGNPSIFLSQTTIIAISLI